MTAPSQSPAMARVVEAMALAGQRASVNRPFSWRDAMTDALDAVGLTPLIEAATAYMAAEEAFFIKPNDKRREEGPAMNTARHALIAAALDFARANGSGG